METILQRLFDQKHKLPILQLKKLSDKHKKLLSRMVKGTASVPDRTVAMDALTQVSPASARSAIGDVLTADDTPTHLRAVAASQLGRLGGAMIEKKLLDSLAIDKTLVFQIKVAASLGKAGTRNSFPALQKMVRQRQSLALRRQASLSQILISFRNHESKYKPPAASSNKLLIPRDEFKRSFKIEPAKPKFVNSVLEDIRLDLYGIEPSSTAMQMLCGRNNFAVILSKSVMDIRIKEKFSHPSIVGLIAQQAPSDKSWATRYLLLSWPRDSKKFNLCGYRTDGHQSLYGSVTIDADVGQIELTAVGEGANTPSQIKGQIKGKLISFTELITEVQVTGKRRIKESGIPV